MAQITKDMIIADIIAVDTNLIPVLKIGRASCRERV